MACVEVVEGSIRVDGRRVPLLQAEFHYFRNRTEDWPRILDRIRDAGFPIVTSYAQWNWHEPAAGVFDFDGRTSPERDLPRFLDLCAKRGLGVHLRTGPACCEWRNSGASSFGTPWRAYFDAFWAVAGRFSASQGGPLWLLQIHNEWSDLIGSHGVLSRYGEGVDGFREPEVPYWLELSGMNAHYRAAGHTFDPTLLAHHLEDRYGAIGSLNARWATGFASFEEIGRWLSERSAGTVTGFLAEIDRAYRDARAATVPPAPLLDLLDAFRLYMAYAIRDDVAYARSVCDLPLTHNWPMGDGDAFDRRAGLDLSGYDMYAHASVKASDWLLTMADAQANRLPYSGEFMCGLIGRPIWGGQGRYTPGFARMAILSWAAHGLRGFSLYMFVERDSWRQCPVDRRGGMRESYPAVRSVIHGLREAGVERWRRCIDLVVVKHLPYHEAASKAPETHFDRGFAGWPWLRSLLYGDEDPKRSFFDLFHALVRVQVDFEVRKVEPGGRDPGGPRVLLTMAMPWMDATLADRLDRHARNGGVTILYPHVPRFDPDGNHLGAFEDLPAPAAARTVSGRVERSGGRGVVAEVADCRVRPVPPPGDAEETLRIDGQPIGYRVSRGNGYAVVLGFDPAADDDLLRAVLEEWGGARVHAHAAGADAGASLFAVDDRFAVAAFNGGRSPAAVSVPGLPPGRWLVRDLLDPARSPRRVDAGEQVSTLGEVAPRDGALLLLEPVRVGSPDVPDVADEPRCRPGRPAEVLSAGWEMLRCAPIGEAGDWMRGGPPDGWTETPAAEWTLPALASGRVLGVEGWFRLRAPVTLEPGETAIEIRLRPRAWQNLGVVHWNGDRVGTFACERPDGEWRFSIPRGTAGARTDADPGHWLAIRLFRPTLECHDVGVSGFDAVEVVTNRRVIRIDRFLLAQEPRDTAPPGLGPADADAHGDWESGELPMRLRLRRNHDRIWLRAPAPGGLHDGARLQLAGENAVVTAWAGSRRIASTPWLPTELSMDGAPSADAGFLYLCVDPDDASLDDMPRDDRFARWTRAALDEVDVRIDPPRLMP